MRAINYDLSVIFIKFKKTLKIPLQTISTPSRFHSNIMHEVSLLLCEGILRTIIYYYFYYFLILDQMIALKLYASIKYSVSNPVWMIECCQWYNLCRECSSLRTSKLYDIIQQGTSNCWSVGLRSGSHASGRGKVLPQCYILYKKYTIIVSGRTFMTYRNCCPIIYG